MKFYFGFVLMFALAQSVLAEPRDLRQQVTPQEKISIQQHLTSENQLTLLDPCPKGTVRCTITGDRCYGDMSLCGTAAQCANATCLATCRCITDQNGNKSYESTCESQCWERAFGRTPTPSNTSKINNW